MTFRIVAIAAIASLAIAPAALADDTFEFDFSFSPTEVSTDIGAEQTYEKLEAMIKDKCEPSTTREKIRYMADTEACVDATLTEVVAKINKPEITSIHEARRG